MRKKLVGYEVGRVTYVDILRCGELIHTKTAGEISRTIRLLKEAVQSVQLRAFKTKLEEIPDDDYANFSDLSIVSIPLRRKKY